MLKRFGLLLCLWTHTVMYADFIVYPGETVTTTEMLNNIGGTGIVERGGAILITAALTDAVHMNAADQQVFNNGMISSTTLGNGIVSSQINAYIQNTGQISATGGDAISTGGSNTLVQNFGSAFGFFNLATINNTGNDSKIQNAGLITGTTSGGISNTGSNTLIQNTGSIIVDLTGITISAGSNIVVENYGIINGAQAAIIDNANGSQVINGGFLISQNQALEFTGMDQTLVLLQGSNIQGLVATTNALNLTVGSGLNLLLTLSSGTFGTLDIRNPYVLVGSTIALLDPTELAMQSDIAADISDTILNGIYRHRGDFPCRTPCSWSSDLWVEGLGSYRKRTQPHLTEYIYEQGGFLAGYDIGTPDGHFSAFGGILVGKGVLDPKRQNLNTATAFGGGYYEKQCKTRFFALSCAGGFTRVRNKRQVAYNFAPGGIETAYSTLFAPFVTPEITYSHFLPDCWIFPDCWISPTISGTLRYIALFARGYAESGSLADLTVKHRTLQLMTVRGVVGFPVCGCDRKVEPFFGGGGRFQFGGNDITATLLGTELFFNAGAPRNLGYVIAGFALSSPFGPFLLNFSGEVNADNYHSYRFLAEGSLGLSF